MKQAFFTIAMMAVALTSAAKDRTYTLSSPDNSITVKVTNGKDLCWSVSKDGVVVLNDSKIAMTVGTADLSSGEAGLVGEWRTLGGNSILRKASYGKVDRILKPQVPTKSAEIHDLCNELTLTFKDGWQLKVRAYDNGVAYRFVTTGKGQVIVKDEKAEFNFNEDVSTFWPKEKGKDYITHCEALFENRKISSLDKKEYAFLPIYFAPAQGPRVVVTESDLEDYPCMFMIGDHCNSVQAVFPPFILEAQPDKGRSDRNEVMVRKADYIAVTSASRSYPWRIVTVDENDAALLENCLAWQLGPEPVAGDVSWVKPGKIAWDWWNALNIYGVDFESGENTATYKYYVDFAAKYGLEYILLDEGWSASTRDISKARPEIDMEELVSYASSKGVKVILWALWAPMRNDLEKILDIYKNWGIAGIKVDFMQRSDQEMVNVYERIAKAAFDRHLVVDFHGSFKPSGLQKKYANVLNFEGVLGLENDKWANTVTPGHDCELPFTRMVAGPMDYTPGACRNYNKKNFRYVHNEPSSQGTRAHQAAMYVIYEAPLQMLADSPSNYLKEPEYTAFISKMPVTWDETIGLESEAGKLVTIARRKGDKWYVAGMTDWTPRDMEIDLGFLGEGEWTAEVFEDGVNADKVGSDCRLSSRKVSSAAPLKVHLAPGGGFAAVISK